MMNMNSLFRLFAEIVVSCECFMMNMNRLFRLFAEIVVSVMMNIRWSVTRSEATAPVMSYIMARGVKSPVLWATTDTVAKKNWTAYMGKTCRHTSSCRMTIHWYDNLFFFTQIPRSGQWHPQV